MRRNALPIIAPLFLLAACASEPGPSLETQAREDTAGASSYGLFLAGEAALNDGRSGEAARYFEQAGVGGDALIGERAFTAALLEGDVPRAASIAPVGDDATPAVRPLARLTLAVEYMATDKADKARPLLAANRVGLHAAASALLAPWAAAMDGDIDGSITMPNAGDDRIVAYFGQLGQARLFEHAKRYGEAETDFKILAGGDSPGDMVVLDYGAFLERRGRRDEALALYNTLLKREPANSSVKVARDRAAARRPAPALPSLRQDAADALLGPAATLIAAKQTQNGLAYLRLLLRLNPEADHAWLLVGDVLTDQGDLAGAREAYAKPKKGAEHYADARAKLAWSYQNAGDGETALKMAREAAASGDYEARLTLADLLRANEKDAESTDLLTGLIAEDPANWRLLYARGTVYERLGRWDEAEADLLAALKIAPDDPELLNYLGYSWIDRGKNLSRAMGMIEKALAANPKSGAVIDSLGWAYYRQGDYETAVSKLEEAVELEAGDPEINNHLGDAYWRVGRRDEAIFQWRRVLTLDPSAKIKADAEAKIASGLAPISAAKSAEVRAPQQQ